jgi:hypothetical protein
MATSLVKACEDRRLIGLEPHLAQRELLELIGVNPIVVAACGRRFGKTKAAAAAALWNLLLVPELDLSGSEKRYAMSIANSQVQARLFVDHARTLVQGSPTLRAELVSDTANELVFRGNRVLAAFPCTAKGIRGYAASFVCLDEFAHFFDTEEGGPAVATKIWAAVRPSVAQFGKNGRTVLISTPMGADNLFASLWQKAGTGQIKGAAAFQAPTARNPMIDADFLAAEEAALGPDDFRREFGAEFIAGGGAFFDSEEIRAVTEDWKELLPGDAKGWTLAIDPAGGKRDPVAIALVGRDPWGSSNLVCGLVRRWLPERKRWKPGSESSRWVADVMEEVAGIARRFGVSTLVSDQYAPGTVIEEARKHGVGVQIQAWSSETQAQAFQSLRSRISQAKIRLPDDEQVRLELARVRTNFRAQTSRVELPRVGDSHCDLASALAAAAWQHDRFGGPGPSPEFWRRYDELRAARPPALSRGIIKKVF